MLPGNTLTETHWARLKYVRGRGQMLPGNTLTETIGATGTRGEEGARGREREGGIGRERGSKGYRPERHRLAPMSSGQSLWPAAPADGDVYPLTKTSIPGSRHV